MKPLASIGVRARTTQLNYRPQDLRLLSTSMSSTLVAEVSLPSSIATTTPSTADGASEGEKSNTISNGAIAGIVVGAVAFLAGLCLVLTWLGRRRTRFDGAKGLAAEVEVAKPELDGNSNPISLPAVAELDSTTRFELDGTTSPARDTRLGNGQSRPSELLAGLETVIPFSRVEVTGSGPTAKL